jgi:quercetin 2,3-dioxygenase
VERGRCPPGKLIPTHVHSGTHETFHILEGTVRLFFVDAAGTRTTSC